MSKEKAPKERAPEVKPEAPAVLGGKKTYVKGDAVKATKSAALGELLLKDGWKLA
jgi:hypothetical protein